MVVNLRNVEIVFLHKLPVEAGYASYGKNCFSTNTVETFLHKYSAKGWH